MTTTARPAAGQPRGRTSQVLLVAGVCVAGAVVLTTLAAGLAGDRADLLGALAGGSMALCFFLFGALVVEMATRMAPEASMLVALMTYTLQVALVALVFVMLTSSGAVGTTLTAGWLATGVIVATLAWTAGLMVASARARIPAYDIDLPDPGPATSAPAPRSAPELTSESSFRAPSQAREGGAP